jgi:Holliday junction DNA helicase RuvB
LLQPLRDRCRLLLRFAFYREEDLTTLLVQRSRALRWPVGEAVSPRIAGRSRGTPRLALRLLQACRRVSRAEGACQLEQIDALGLGPVEAQACLGVPARTVSGVVEPFLLRAGLIVKDDGGRRELTARGREHLAGLPALRTRQFDGARQQDQGGRQVRVQVLGVICGGNRPALLA